MQRWIGERKQSGSVEKGFRQRVRVEKEAYPIQSVPSIFWDLSAKIRTEEVNDPSYHMHNLPQFNSIPTKSHLFLFSHHYPNSILLQKQSLSNKTGSLNRPFSVLILGFNPPANLILLDISMIQEPHSHSPATSQSPTHVGIELGGTNYNVAIAHPLCDQHQRITDFHIIARKAGITYQNPTQTLQEINAFIKSHQQEKKEGEKHAFQFIGIASFGPLCLNKQNPLYGAITTTPKILWRGVQVLSTVRNAFEGTKTGIDTDVNAAAYAEFKLGKHGAQEPLAYITVGTGVGVGVIAQGKTIHGLTHPEGGHIVVERAKDEYQHFRGVCPFHKEQTCLEGMVNNKSIAERLNINFTALEEVPDDSKVWKLVAFYLAQLCLNITLLLSPEVIVIGGGIMNRKILMGLIRQEFIRMLAGYVEHPLLGQSIDKYIVSPWLGGDVGVKGAMILSELQ